MTAGRNFQKPRTIIAPKCLSISDEDLFYLRIIDAANKTDLTEFCTTTKGNLLSGISRSREFPQDKFSGYSGLYDELSSYVEQASRPPLHSLLSKVSHEFSTFQAVTRNVPEIDACRFSDLLIQIHRRLGTGLTNFRRTGVQIVPDVKNVRTVFPHWKECEKLLFDLGEFIEKNVERSPILTAMVGYVGVIHAHAFSDGNGRTARVMFNYILSVAGSSHFLPITAIAELANGAFIVKLRRAYLGGEWIGLYQFFNDALAISDELQRCE